MTYKVKLDVFEGPFDLLVYLIENAEMSIYDIQVAEITNQYLQYIERMQENDVSVATEFMVLAAQLIEIKSKMLLPRSTPLEEGIVEEDPRTELVEKILEYKRYKLAAEALAGLEEEKLLSFEKPKEDLQKYTNGVDEYLKMDIKQFVTAFDSFLRKKQRIEEVRKHYTRVERQRQSIEMKIEGIVNFFRSRFIKKTPFSSLIKDKKDRYDVVLTFTSLLQMMRDSILRVEQKSLFGEMEVELIDENQERDDYIPEGEQILNDN